MDLALGYMTVLVFATYFVIVTSSINGGKILSNDLLKKLDIDAEPSMKLFSCDSVLLRMSTGSSLNLLSFLGNSYFSYHENLRDP